MIYMIIVKREEWLNYSTGKKILAKESYRTSLVRMKPGKFTIKEEIKRAVSEHLNVHEHFITVL